MIIAAKRYLWLVSGWAPSTNHSLRLSTQTIPDITAPKVCTFPPYSFWSEQFWLHSRFNQYGTGTEPSILKSTSWFSFWNRLPKSNVIRVFDYYWFLLQSFEAKRGRTSSSTTTKRSYDYEAAAAISAAGPPATIRMYNKDNSHLIYIRKERNHQGDTRKIIKN